MSSQKYHYNWFSVEFKQSRGKQQTIIQTAICTLLEVQQKTKIIMTQLLNKRWNGIAIVLLSSIFFAFVPTSAKIALDSGVSPVGMLMNLNATPHFASQVSFDVQKSIMDREKEAISPKVIAISLFVELLLALYRRLSSSSLKSSL